MKDKKESGHQFSPKGLLGLFEWTPAGWLYLNLVPRVFSLFNMAAAREKTLAHSRSRVSNEDGGVFKMAATAKRVRRTGYEMLR